MLPWEKGKTLTDLNTVAASHRRAAGAVVEVRALASWVCMQEKKSSDELRSRTEKRNLCSFNCTIQHLISVRDSRGWCNGQCHKNQRKHWDIFRRNEHLWNSPTAKNAGCEITNARPPTSNLPMPSRTPPSRAAVPSSAGQGVSVYMSRTLPCITVFLFGGGWYVRSISSRSSRGAC